MFSGEVRASVVDNGLDVNTGILCPLVHLLDRPDHGLHPLEPPVVGAGHHLQAVWTTVEGEQTDQSHSWSVVTTAIVWFFNPENLLYIILELSYHSTCEISREAWRWGRWSLTGTPSRRTP